MLRMGWRHRIGAAAVIALVMSLVAPVALTPGGTQTSPWDLLRSWFIGVAHAQGGGVPQQTGGHAPGPQGQVRSSATDGATGSGRALGKGAGELAAYRPHDASGQPTAAGRSSAPHGQGFEQGRSKRLPKESTATTTIFANPDGSRTADISQGVVNYRGPQGDWLPIETTLVAEASGRLKPKAHGVGISLSTSGHDADLVTVATDSAHSLTFGFPGATTPVPDVEDATARYAAVQPGVDLAEQVTATGIKETLVLHDADAPTTYTFPLSLKGLSAKVGADGGVSLTDAKGAVALTIPPGVMWDSHPVGNGGTVQSDAVTYAVTKVGGHDALTVSIDSDWLHAPDRVFPVFVDPSTVNATTSGSGYYETAKVNGGSTQLRIGTWDSGATHKARSYIAYSGFATQFAKQKVTAATLKLFNIWAGSTSATTSFTVSQVTSGWSAATLASPGPSLGTAMGTWSGVAPSVTRTSIPESPTIGAWENVAFTSAGVGVLNNWIYGLATNYGIGLTTSETNDNYWKIFDSTSASANHPVLSVTYTPNIAPQVDAQFPPNNYAVQTLTPNLLAYGHDTDSFPKAMTFTFTVKNAAGAVVATSGALAKGNWVVPAGTLTWGQTYTWSVTTNDGNLTSLNPRSYALTTSVPQPSLTSELSQNTAGRGFEPNGGNFTNDDTDIDISTVGPALNVERAYNSNDPRTEEAFGAGWATVYDARATTRLNSSGAETGVVVTYPDGREVGFGRNADGTYSPAPGRYSRFASLGTNLGYKLTDKDDTTWTFDKAFGGGVYGLGSISDAEGRTERFTYDASNHISTAVSASNRTLTFGWATPAGASAPHVRTVSSDPVNGAPLTWTYGYTGDLLTSVCSPTSTTQCTTYGYTPTNLYPQAVLGMDPISYYRLSESAGATRAVDSVLARAGSDNGTYAGVTLGGAASLAGSSAPTASFNGTSSNVALGNRLSLSGSYLSVAARFRADAPDGVIFSYQQDTVSAATTPLYTPALYVGTDGKLRGEWWMGSATTPITSSASVVDGKWHDVVLSGAGNTQTMYLDGVKVGTLSGAIAPAAPLNTRNAYLGAGFTGSTWPATINSGKPSAVRYFRGAISDASFYDKALSAADVDALQSATAALSALTTITRPTGSRYSTVTYNTVTGRVASVVDQHGGTWTLKPQTVGGSSQVFASAVLGSAPQNYWRFGDASGPDASNEVNGDQLTFVDGSTLSTTGRFKDSTSATLDGTSGYADFVNDPDDPNDVFVQDGGNQSVGLWFKTTTPTAALAAYQVADLDSGATPTYYVPMLYIGTDGKLRGEYWDGSANPLVSAASVTDGKWHYAVLSATTTNQTLYLDGIQAATRAGTPKFNNAQLGQHGQIGAGFLRSWPAGTASTTVTPSFFKGSITDVSMYRSALSAAQVQAQYAGAVQSDGPAAVQTAAMSDPANKTISYDYDLGNGNRTLAETDALGNTTQYGYDIGGFLYTTTDPNGNVTTTGHDVRGNVVSTKTCQDFSAAKCSTAYMTYFPDDTTLNPTPDPRNDTIATMRDGRSSSATDNTYLTTYQYDTAGNQTSVTTPAVPGFPSGRTTVTTYTTAATAAVGGGTTPAGLPASVTTPGGKVTQLSYAANGDLVRQQDPSGLVTTFAYDEVGRVTSKTQVSDAYPTGLTTTYEYDGNDQITKQTDPGSRNAVTGVTHTPVTTTSFDANGNVVSQTVSDATGSDPSRTTSASFDAHDNLASATDAPGGVTSYTYDAYGNRSSETDPTHNTMAYAYDAEGRLLTVTAKAYTGDPNNPSPAQDVVLSSRAYDPAGRLAALTDAMGRVTTYTYTDDGLMASVVRTSGASSFVVKSVLHDAAGNIISESTNNNTTVTKTTVDAAGRPTTIVLDPNGLNRTTSLVYDGDDNVTQESVTDGATGSRTTTNAYDANGALVRKDVTGSVAPSTTLTTSYVRDQRGALLSAKDPLGRVTTYINDESGQVTSVVSAAVQAESGGNTAVSVQPTTTFGYDTFGEQTHVKDANGNVTVTDFDALGRTVAEHAPSYTPPGSSIAISPVTRTTYDAAGQVTSTTDASGNTTTYLYDQLGDLAKQTDPDGGVVTSTYDLAGEQLSQVDPTGAVSSATYDYMGRVVTRTDQVRQPTLRNATTTLAYGANGWLASTKSPAGVTTTQAYNAVGEPTSITDGAGNTTGYTYDFAGRLLRTANPDNTSTQRTYDDAGNVLSSSDLSGTTVLRTSSATYDNAGHVLTTTDPRGGGATYTYDTNGQVLTESQKVDASTSITTSFGYDAAGNRTRFSDGRGNVFVTTYNSWNLPESQIEPSTTAYPNAADRTFTASYDASARVAGTAAPGGVKVTNTYDTMGRLTGAVGTGAEATTANRVFGYDKSGHLTSASAPGGTNTFSYDDRGALLSADGPSGTSRFTYTLDGQLESRTDAAGLTNYAYDTAGRLASVADPATGQTATYAYRSLNLLDSITYGGGNKRTFGYDSLHRLTTDTMKTSAGAAVASITYGYDLSDNTTSKSTVGLAGPATNTYTYDLANRLASWNNGSTTTSYGYDASGNRTQAGSLTYTYDARNQLLGDGSKTYRYTARGTLASVTSGSATTNSTFDAFNQAISQGPSTYTYDAFGRLGSATASGGTTSFAYSGLANTVASDGGSTYTWDNADGLLAVGRGTTTTTPLFAWTDQHDDVVGQFASSGTALARSVAYDPWGTLLTSPTLAGGLGFQSGWTDQQTGRVDMLSRWYDPSVGQFISRDSVSLSPVPNSASANKFAYVNDNPLGGTDPTGECSWYDVVCGVKSAASSVSHAVSSTWSSVSSYASSSWSSFSSYAYERYTEVKSRVTSAYHAAKRVVHHVVTAAKHVVHKAVHYVKDAYHAVKHYASKAWSAVKHTASRVYHAVKHYAKAAYHAVSTAVHKVGHAIKTGYQAAKHAVAKAGAWVAKKASQAKTFVKEKVKQGAQFLKKHAATIASFAASTVVFMGCEAAVTVVTGGALSVPGAAACGALAGAAGNMAEAAVSASQSGRSLSMGELGSAAASGAMAGAIGGAGGALLGKAVAVVGSKLSGPVTKMLGRGASDAEGALDDGIGAVCRIGHSFTASTGVVLATGVVVAIAGLHVGDHVKTVDQKTGQVRSQAVVRVMVNHDRDLLDVTVRYGSTSATIHTTASHPFWSVTRKAWVRADRLTTSDVLASSDAPSGATRSAALTVERVAATPGAEDRWDLTVETDHDYFVSTTASDVLVHNCGEQVAYNSDALSSAAHQARVASGIGPGRNVAAASVEGLDKPIIGFSQGGGYHAEMHILDQLERLKIPASKVTGLYSDRQPCSGCAGMLADAIPESAPISWAVPWSSNPVLKRAANRLLTRFIREAS